MTKKKKKVREAPEKRKDAVPDTTYFFAFEILKPYNYSRSYIIKEPLKKSFKESVGELLVGRVQ